MERRTRTTRASVPAAPLPTTRRSPVRRSPAKSPSRKSPARTITRRSPVRRSPARAVKMQHTPPKKAVKKRSPSPVEQSQRGRSTRSKVVETKILKEIEEQIKKSPRTPKLVLNNISISPKSINSVKKRLNDSLDVEVSEITSIGTFQANKENTPEPSQHSNLTPTPSRKTTVSRSVSRFSHSNYDDNSEYSDNGADYEKTTDNKTEYSRRIVTKSLEFGGTKGAFLWFLTIPVICFFIQYYCNKTSCKSYKASNLNELKSLKTYYNLDVSLLYLAFTTGVALLSAIPLGRFVKHYGDKGINEYYFNGLTSAIIATAGITISEYTKIYPIIDLIYKNYIQLYVTSIAYALIISTFCYFRSRNIPMAQWNPYAKTHWSDSNIKISFFDFFVGRSINPKWFHVIDIKLVHYRISLILTLILNGIFAYKNLVFAQLPTETTLSLPEKVLNIIENVKFDQLSLVISGLIIIYVLDLLIFEHHLTSSFELQNEGVGSSLLVRYAVFPFVFSMISKYSFEHQMTNVPDWAVILLVVGFLFGVGLKRYSNSIKYQYRMTPDLKKFACKYFFF